MGAFNEFFRNYFANNYEEPAMYSTPFGTNVEGNRSIIPENKPQVVQTRPSVGFGHGK